MLGFIYEQTSKRFGVISDGMAQQIQSNPFSSLENDVFRRGSRMVLCWSMDAWKRYKHILYRTKEKSYLG